MRAHEARHTDDDDRANQRVLFTSGRRFHLSVITVETNEHDAIVKANMQLYAHMPVSTRDVGTELQFFNHVVRYNSADTIRACVDLRERSASQRIVSRSSRWRRRGHFLIYMNVLLNHDRSLQQPRTCDLCALRHALVHNRLSQCAR
jgi:hypothetical protein